MKRLLLGLLILSPAIIRADDTSISENWRRFNSYRIVAGVKATLQGFMAGYAGWRALNTVGHCSEEIQKLIKTDRTRKQLETTLDNSVFCGGMAYTSYLLACYAWANAKHALAIR